MTDDSKKTFRSVTPRRIIALGGVAAVAIGSPLVAQTDRVKNTSSYVVAQAEGEGEGSAEARIDTEGEGEAAVEGKSFPEFAVKNGGSAESGEGEAAEGEGEGEAAAAEGEGEAAAGGEGEGEGGTANLAPDVAFLTGLAFMEGHLRAGLALYEAGDLIAAKTHMGHPIEEKYDAVAERLDALGHGDLRETITALATAAEAEDPYEKIAEMFDEVRETHEEVRANFGLADQFASYAALTRVAADEYSVAVEGRTLSNLHEYQDAWGFLRVIETEASELAESNDARISETAGAILEQVEATGAAFGDLQGEGEYEKDPSILYVAAARIELATLGSD